jgi:hypothetical protein
MKYYAYVVTIVTSLMQVAVYLRVVGCFASFKCDAFRICKGLTSVYTIRLNTLLDIVKISLGSQVVI